MGSCLNVWVGWGFVVVEGECIVIGCEWYLGCEGSYCG